MQKKPAYTHIVVVLAWKRSSFQQLPREKPGIWLKLQRTHPKMRSTPQAIPSLPSAAPTLREHLPTKAHPAPSPTCSCSSAPEALPSQPLPSTSLFPNEDKPGGAATAATYGEGTDEVGSCSVMSGVCSLLSHELSAANPSFLWKGV